MSEARRRQWAIFCMAVILTGTVFIVVIATQNFYTIDRLLESSSVPVFRDAAASLDHPSLRELLRYSSSELNRLYFQLWNLAEIALGLGALYLVRRLPGAKKPVYGIVAMLGVVLFLTAAITPYIVSIGRSLDFMPREPAPPGMRTFGLLHATYSVLTLVNLVLGVLVTLWIQRTGE